MMTRHTRSEDVALRRFAMCVMLCAAAAVPRAQTQDEFFSADALHEVRLTLSGRDWQALKDRPEDNTYYAADLQWKGIVLRNVGIRSRGHVTRNGLKPGLRVDMNRYLSEQRFLGLTAFTLDNAYNDVSLIRERLTMLLFNRMGIAAPRETHARLFINEEYAGVYAIIEQVIARLSPGSWATQKPMSSAAATCSNIAGCGRTASNTSDPTSSPTPSCSHRKRETPTR